MAPRQGPHQPIAWRDAHPFFLLSPLMGLLSWAWSRLRGPGAPELWLGETITSADQGEAKASLAVHYAPWGRHPQVETIEEDGEASWGAHPDLKASNSLLEAWGLSDDDDDDDDDDDEDYSREKATSVPREQGSEYIDGQPAFLSPSLLRRTLQGPPGEEEFEEGGVAEVKVTTFFSVPPSHWGCRPGVEEGKEEEEDGEAINKEAPRTSTSPLSPGPKPRDWAYYAREEEARAKEEERRTENKEARTPFISLFPAGSHPSTWKCCSGEESEELEDGKAEKGEASPGPHSVLTQRPLLRTWQYQPSKITEEEEEEDEDNVSGEAKGFSSDSHTSTFLRAWVYQPGEDTEEEDEDSASEAAEEEEETEGPSSMPPTSTFLRAWVYRPGEDTEEEDEDSASEAAEEEEETEGPSSVPPTSAFLRAWVYQPGEDTEEEEEEENEDEKDDSEAADSGPSSSLQAQSALLRGWTYPSGERTEGGEAADEREEAEHHPFRVTIYLPGEKPPPPWTPPRLPLRLQRRLKSLKSAETPTQHLDPETPQKTRMVRFSEKVSIHYLAVWAGPAQAARQGPWEQLARDRSRFARRIAQAQEKLGPCLTPAARAMAWVRLGNPPPSLAAISTPTRTLPISAAQATPLSHAVASPSPLYVSLSPCLDLSGRRG
ncbi:PREDICTED: protein phosphatase 1 regulatory subunit 15A [Hipposideros armiger]|uniref:Protein phosphatase 1 regulatory subunit 15A n=1 Tax=Hipposideros armiger TaxID=186990 RepID=A0A8B7SLY1_HIPAR|nr:PREDICTED: protein phosphatase 1 regulatory subunit 15A [Hipposideros armiger]